MFTSLNQQQVDAYHTSGFLHIPGFLTEEQVERLSGLVADTRNLDDLGNVKSESNRVLVDLWKKNAELDAFNRSLGPVFSSLFRGERCRLWNTKLFVKAPGGAPTYWHHDADYLPLVTNDSASVWIALADVPREKGCLFFLPGSHRIADRDPNREISSLEDIVRYFPKLEQVSPVECVLKAGDCTIHSGTTFHASQPNRSTSERIGYVVTAFSADAALYPVENNKAINLKYLQEEVYSQPWPNDDRHPVLSPHG